VSARYFDANALLTEAQAIVGSRNWGDGEWRAPFGAFIDALNADAELTEQGVERTRSHIMKLLVGRLRLYADRERYPQIAEEEIRAPLFIAGHGRSGTSYVQSLLASDRRSLSPRHWQIWTLSPPITLATTDNAPQRAAGEHYIGFEGWQADDVREKHDYTSEGVAEDTLIVEYAFTGYSFPFFWNVPSYGRWLAQQGDPGAGYRIHRKVLQAIQFGQERSQWVLKNPSHIALLPHLFAEYPDARMVLCHRDPVKSMAPIVGLLYAHRRQFGNAFQEFGRDYVLASIDGAVASTRAMMAWREESGLDARFADVLYLDLEREPLGEVEKVYDRHGLDFTRDARAAMADYVAANRKGRFGAHRYDIRDLGVEVEEVRERFAFYYDAFGIPCEEPGQ